MMTKGRLHKKWAKLATDPSQRKLSMHQREGGCSTKISQKVPSESAGLACKTAFGRSISYARYLQPPKSSARCDIGNTRQHGASLTQKAGADEHNRQTRQRARPVASLPARIEQHHRGRSASLAEREKLHSQDRLAMTSGHGQDARPKCALRSLNGVAGPWRVGTHLKR